MEPAMMHIIIKIGLLVEDELEPGLRGRRRVKGVVSSWRLPEVLSAVPLEDPEPR